MRILQVVTRNELRGAEVFAGQLADAFVQRGHDVRQAALYAREPGITPLPFQRATPVELLGRKKGRIEPLVLFRLHRLLREFRPDIVQANGFHALKFCSLLKRLPGSPWPLAYRNISVASGWVGNSIKRRWGCWLASRIDRVLSVSDASADDFSATYSVLRDRVQTIRRGVEIPATVDVPAARRVVGELTGAHDDAPVLMHLGGFTEEKNHAGLLEAFAAIRQVHPAARLLMLGDGPLRKRVEQLISDGELSQSAFCPGNRTDARNLLCAADVLMLTSLIEGIPGVVLEAAARGVPAVSTNVGAVGEVIEHGVTGLLAPPGEMQQLASLVNELLVDDARRRRIGAAARRLVEQTYSMERAVSEFENVYNLLCDEKPHRA